MKATGNKTSTASNENAKPFFTREGTSNFFPGVSDGKNSFFAGGSIIQARLTVGQPGDPFEQEADAMADRVVQRLPAVGLDKRTNNEATQRSQPDKAIGTSIQARCDSCEAEDKLQKKDDMENETILGDQLQKKPIFESNAEPPDDEDTIRRKCAGRAAEGKLQMQPGPGPAGAVSDGVESSLSSSRGGGAPLPETARSQMESSFGNDFSHVRVHTGSSAIQMNEELSAQAFTHGSDIYFNSGKYDADSNQGKHLLAHELTHVVQQGATSGIIRRFGSKEHKALGDSTGIMIDIGDGVSLSFGDIVALAGDEYKTPEELWDDTKTPVGRAKLRSRIENAGISPATAALLPAPSADQVAATDTNYYLLALNNTSHFSAGGTAFDDWKLQHGKAVALAMQAGFNNNKELMNQANFTEAFSDHYLTDAFSSGHVRTPRKEIEDYYVGEVAPRVYDHIIHTLGSRMVDEIYDQIGGGPWYAPEAIVKSRIANGIHSRFTGLLDPLGGQKVAVTYLGQILGGVIVLAMHDKENNEGLWVTSKAHPLPWQALGDGSLEKNQLHKDLILQAIQVSLADLQKAYDIGLDKSQFLNNLMDERFLPEKVYFKFDSVELSATDKDLVASLGDYLLYHPTTIVNLNGHTDPMGEDAYNEDLGLRRAQSVAAILLDKGVDSNRIKIHSFGEKFPVSKHPKKYNLDRRVEILYQSALTIDQRTSGQMGYDEVVEEVSNKVGPPYAAEDHFPQEVIQSSPSAVPGISNPALPEWRWGKMSESLKQDLNVAIKGYMGMIKTKVSQTDKLNETTIEGYTVRPRPIVEGIINDLAADPARFLGDVMGEQAN